jgi:hypothetical protein
MVELGSDFDNGPFTAEALGTDEPRLGSFDSLFASKDSSWAVMG